MTRFKGLAPVTAALQVGAPGTDVVLMDGAITIGQLPLTLLDAGVLVNATLTDNNAGQANNPDISINVAAGQTAVIPMMCSEYLKQVNSFLTPTSVPSVNNSGKYADGSGDNPPSKGISVTGFELAYTVQGGPLTSINFRADYANFVNGVANAFTSIVANTELGVANRANTANATTPRIVTIAVASPIFDIIDNTYLYVKISPVTPGGCTFRLYSVMMNVSFNWN